MNGCIYCGIINGRMEVDHVPPLALVAQYGVEWLERRNVKFLLVPACKECNSAAGSKGETIYARGKRLLSIYRRRYGDLEYVPHWSVSDLDELGYNLRSFVEDAALASDVWRRRYENLTRFITPYGYSDQHGAFGGKAE